MNAPSSLQLLLLHCLHLSNALCSTGSEAPGALLVFSVHTHSYSRVA